jgi:hypothetical protein
MAGGASGAGGGKAGGNLGGRGGAPTDGGADSGMAGGGGATTDAGIPHPIKCGTGFCAAGQQFCCIPSGNEPPRCVSTGNAGACPDGSDRAYCDDRTDCAQNEVCCAGDVNGDGMAMCSTVTQCNGIGRMTQQLCDPLLPMQCLSVMMNACRADGNSIIMGYAYCH